MFDPANPFPPCILVFNQAGTKIRGPLGKPSAVGGFQPAGPAVDIAFENGFRGGRLFATDSNQATHAAGQNNSSRIVTVNPITGQVQPFITGLPKGDHPSAYFGFEEGFLFWTTGCENNHCVVWCLN